ncbi:MAG: DUF2252 domain-containing protein [Acidobacteriota bacterium]
MRRAKPRQPEPSLRPAPTRDERTAAGKALRDKVSRKSQGGWKAPPRRRDPIELLIRSSRGRLPQLIPIRYGRMMQSPFAFYRGAAAIMAADLAGTPASGIRVQACGDCHLMNFGGSATPERHIVFDISDFDESLPAPWEWDLKRLVASVVIASQNNGFKKGDARQAAVRCARSYRDHLAAYAEMRALERWYARIDAEDLIALVDSKPWKKRIEKQVARESARSVVEDDFPKLTVVRNGVVRIKDNPPLIFHPGRAGAAEHSQVIHAVFRRYRDSLSDDRKALMDHYEIKDLAAKVVGVGSVGTRCGILLMMAGADDPLFLQVKEARASVLEPYAGKSRYANCGQRVVAGQKLMQAASDLFLGWTADRGRHYYLRQLRDIKITPLVEVFDAPALTRYAEWCGWALARAHAKSGDAAKIGGYLGRSDRFDEAMADFATAYAGQNERDHQALLTAIRAGRIDVIRES